MAFYLFEYSTKGAGIGAESNAVDYDQVKPKGHVKPKTQVQTCLRQAGGGPRAPSLFFVI
jgi:hypothetical protein